MKKYAIIADIAGQFETLMNLVDKIPKDHEIILLGDLVDRGPDSMIVIEWARKSKIRSVYGNHEDMFVNGYRKGITAQSQHWIKNGGGYTLRSYEKNEILALDHIKWLKTLPRIIRLKLKVGDFNEVVLTHGTIHSKYKKGFSDTEILNDTKDFYEQERSVIWCRRAPDRRPFLQISGHNSRWGYREFKDDEGVYAISLDQSQEGKLTALLLPSLEVIEESYPE